MDTVSNFSPLPISRFQDFLNTAQDAVRNQDFIASEKYFREALKQQNNSAIALAGLGQSLCRLTRPNEGLPFLCQAAKVLLKDAKQTGETQSLLDLAYQMIHWHAPEEAFKFAKETLGIKPNSANAYHIAALGLQALNRHAEAYSFSKRAVELAPQESNALILLAVLEAKLGKLNDARNHLEVILSKADDANAARAHMELGVILDKASEFDLAFKHLSEAGMLNLNSVAARRIDKSAVYLDISQYKESFDARFLQSATHRLVDDGFPAPVFLIGFYRSGTTLAEQILSAHDQVISSDEAHLITEVINELLKTRKDSMSLPEQIKSLDNAEITRLRKIYWETAKRTLGPHVTQKVLVDKTALNTLNIELINTLFPDALVIFALRDPRDVCLSCFMQPFNLSPLTVHFLNWNDSARFYALIMDYWLSIRESLSVQWIELRYEDVVNDLEGQFRPIFIKMGLQWSNECNEFYRHSQLKIIKTPSFDQVTRPLYNSSVERWRHYEKHFTAIMPELKPYIESFGYAS